MRHKMPIARIHHDIGFPANAIRGACLLILGSKLRRQTAQRTLVSWLLEATMTIETTLTEFVATDAKSFISALGFTTVHLLGCSLGGMVAELLAAEHPKLWGQAFEAR
jgi:pimeloyl-ACP methyl ester carboxylesterase